MDPDLLLISIAFVQLALLLSNRSSENHNTHCELLIGYALIGRVYRNLNIKRSLMTYLLITVSVRLMWLEVYLRLNYPDKKHVFRAPKRTTVVSQ